MAFLVAPGLRRPGEAFSLGIRFEDRWGNPTAPEKLSLRLKADAQVIGLPEQVTFPAGNAAMRVGGLSIAAPVPARITLTDEENKELAISNPIVVAEGGRCGLLGRSARSEW